VKLSPSLLGVLGSALGGTGHFISGASNVALLVGAIYLADCRFSSKAVTREAVDSCYFTALPLMGIGVAGKGGFAAGFSTYNPALRRPEEQEHPATGGSRRDASGRFTGGR